MFNIGSGIAQGMMSYHKGYDEQVKLNELKQERELRMKKWNQELEQGNVELKEAKLRLDKLEFEARVRDANSQRDEIASLANNVINSISKHTGTRANIETETISGDNLPENFDRSQYSYNEETNTYSRVKKTYSEMPKDLKEAIDNLNSGIVQNPRTAGWINNFLDRPVDNPVTKAYFDESKYEFVLEAKDGSEALRASPGMFMAMTGFDKSLQASDLKKIQETDEANKRLFEQNKEKREQKELELKIQDQANKNKKLTSEIKESESRANYNDALAEKARAEAAGGGKRSATQIKEDKSLRLQEKNDKYLEMKSNAELNDSISKDLEFFDNVIAPDGTQRKSMQESIRALYIVDAVNDVEKLMNTLQKEPGSNDVQVDDAFWGIVNRYVPVTEEMKKNSASREYITTLATQVITDAIKEKSGAAFSQTELDLQKQALADLNSGASLPTLFARVQAYKDGWVRTANGALSGTKEVQRRYAYGAVENIHKERLRIKDAMARREATTNKYLVIRASEVSKLSGEEQLAWWNSLNDTEKAYLKAIREKEKTQGGNK